ncbi:MAG: hypothetical protein K0B37_02025 [Bacteroidales bacterium]|nr:hypothetical protein [Bacteroidales bacterium]
MKKTTFIIAMFLALGIMFNACEKDEVLTMSSEETYELKKENAMNANSFEFDPNACVDEPHTFTINAPVGTNLQVQYEETPGNWIQIFQISQSTLNPTEFEYTFVYVGEFNLRIKYGNGGFNDAGSIIVEDCNGCETQMRGETFCEDIYEEDELIYNRKAVFTFTPEEAGNFKIQGGLTNFTSELFEVTTTIGESSSRIPGGSSNRIITVIGEIESCDPVVITVKWFSDNDSGFITGKWTAELNGEEVMIIDSMECDDDKDGYAPEDNE